MLTIMARGNIRTLLLLTSDEHVAQIITPLLDPAWTLARHDGRYMAPEIFAHPHIGIVVFDDEGVAESDRGWLLNRIRKRTAGASLIYIANNHDATSEKLARGGGAHYYVSKPLSLEHFGHVLQSFLRAQK